VTDAIPLYTNYISSDHGGTYNSSARTVTWSVSQISPGEIISLGLVLIVDDEAQHETVLQNSVFVDNGQIEVVESNTVELTVTHLPVLQLASVNSVSCFGGNNGSATVTVTGGVPPYTVTWQTSPVQTGWEAVNLYAGTYNVSIEDAMGYTDEISVTITQPEAALNASLNITHVLCHGESTGSIDLEVFDGTPPYSFLWSNSATTQNIDGLTAGNYSVIITDANGCTLNEEAVLEQPEEPIYISGRFIEGVECIDDPFGSVNYDINGGTPPYTYLWDNGETSMTLNNATGGDHVLTITDANGCQLIENFFVEYLYDQCDIRVPGGLTPYSEYDNKFVIRGLEMYPYNTLRIFNRYGTMIYMASPYQNDWDGVPNLNRTSTESDGKVPSGTYFYTLELLPGGKPLSGYIYLIKN